MLFSPGPLFELHVASCEVCVYVFVRACMCGHAHVCNVLLMHDTISALTITSNCLEGHTFSLVTITVFSR
jgi:hypothetical protein